ncbi:hypothetical protein GLAREA_09668 [Glarea lozoyensis ATCC 20868]|uniref:Uncharacterized protein n=1 Tax=Glarea lozoyensis (strain ATCC 20868 / MF5171) TaxID=1116229 RepID=S3CPY5_GLAL2|nr:uncharacterized protein GLAREA_09668 [Glarea lozoyensis ATCC 20868]EPE28547.1 hypothetical protein GLAREA_09668 [Glarea lozoyensis ATCC 20868]
MRSRIRLKRHRPEDESFITIRWSCEKLGQQSEEGIFFIEPKAHFKILFGCASTAPTEAIASRSTRSVRSNKEPQISSWAASSFGSGIRDRVLLPVKRMPDSSTVDDVLFPSFAELEDELHHFHSVEATIDDDLLSSNNNALSTNYSSVTISSQTTMDITHLTSNSLATLSNDSRGIPSTRTTLSDEFYNSGFTHSRPEVSRGEISHSTSIDRYYSQTRWLEQPPHEDPQSWVRPQITTPHASADQSTPRTAFHVTCYENLTPMDQAMLDDARRAAEEETREYWIWDETYERFKHYDPGCAEPVWYNPPT